MDFNIISRLKKRFLLTEHTKRFIAHNKKKWAKRYGVDNKNVILIDLFDSNPHTYCFSYAANYLAKKCNASLHAFLFVPGFANQLGLPFRRLEKIYESFGAKLTLTYRNGARFRKQADQYADETFKNLRTKMDVLEISFDGLEVGKFIYDSYLRTARLDLKVTDPLLKKMIRDAYLGYLTCKDYFATHNVKAVFMIHTVYISHGIITSYAMKLGIPIFCITPNNFTVNQNMPDTLYFVDYPRFKEKFQTFSSAEQIEYRNQGRKLLEDRLSGILDPGIATNAAPGRPGLSGYGPPSENRLMKDTGRPRIAVLLNCFFDAPHGYRYLLFADFWEWINFLLERAEKTPFDWYVKPHPGGLPGNSVVVEQLKKTFPNINFLDITASNKQLVQEGLSAMFTTYGSAGAEFAYMGIPVVNAGDTPRIAYDFNLHPKTVEEYEKCIFEADQLKVDIKKSEVEEFFYMHDIYSMLRKNEFDAYLIDAHLNSVVREARVNEPSILDEYIETETPKKLENVEKYLEHYFSKIVPLS